MEFDLDAHHALFRVDGQLKKWGPSFSKYVKKASLELIVGNPMQAIEACTDARRLSETVSQEDETFWLEGIAWALLAATALGKLSMAQMPPPDKRNPDELIVRARRCLMAMTSESDEQDRLFDLLRTGKDLQKVTELLV